jgi:D-lactate dehydrogenase
MATIAFDQLEPWQEDYVKKKLPKHTLVFIDGSLSDKNVSQAKAADIFATFIYSKVGKDLIAKMPKVKLITTMSTGFDHIDLPFCAKKKITVCNVPSYGEHTVAEHTFALLLSVTRRIVESVQRTREGRFDFEGLLGTDIHGKTLGVVGTGKIGRNVAHIGGEGFGMKVLAYDAFPNKEWAKECGIEYVPFEKLLAQSDVITFHVPLLPETTHMLNRKNISKVKKGAIVINTARGAVVETAALVEGLNKGILRGVGTDVLEEECDIKEGTTSKTCSILLSDPRAYITPHSAFYSREALQRILDTTVDNINAFLAGKPANTVK